MKKLALVAVLIPMTFACFSPRNEFASLSEPRQKTRVDQVKIIKLARGNHFDELEKLLENYQRNYERDLNQELALYYAYETFRNSDPSLLTILDRWAKEYPTSYIPKLARGNYLMQRGMNSRGIKVIADTSEQQLLTMEDCFRSAEKDFEAAIKLYPRSLSGYVGLIYMKQMSGISGSAQILLDNTFKVHPGSIMVRQTALFFQMRNWGGTAEALDEMMAEVQSASKKYNNLQVLSCYRDYVAGMDRYADASRDYAGAQGYFKKALASCDYFYYRLELANMYSYDKKFEQSLIEFNSVLNTWPHERRALRVRARTLALLNRCDKAQDDLNILLEIDPADEYSLKTKNICASNQTR